MKRFVYTRDYNNIKYYGLVTGLEKKEFYSKSDLFLFPSVSENFGIVIAEALSYGCSVLTSIKSPWNKHLEDGVLETFELTETDYSITKKIINIFNLKKNNNNLKLKANQIIREHYDYDSMVKQISKTYSTIFNVK